MDSVGYDVQPADAGPSGAKNEAVRTAVAANMVQNDSRFRVGKAMSRAPIINGTQKFPNPPIRIGVMAKKIMMVPCIVKRAV